MMAMGMPSYVVLCNLMHELERGVDSSLKDVMQEIRGLPCAVTSCILDQCQVNGAVPITGPQVEVTDELMGCLQSMEEVSRRRGVLSEDPAENLEPCAGKMWRCGKVWGGRLHMVPADFKLPKCNVLTMWDLYWGGHPVDGICPFRFLVPWDLMVKSDRVCWS